MHCLVRLIELRWQQDIKLFEKHVFEVGRERPSHLAAVKKE
jgi:hypothetical protein